LVIFVILNITNTTKKICRRVICLIYLQYHKLN